MSQRKESRLCLVIAGPNGAGKSTFAHEYLAQERGLVHFINADLIASGLSPLRVKEGGHYVPSVDVRRRFTRSRKNFIEHYRALADAWWHYDNSFPPPSLVAGFEARPS